MQTLPILPRSLRCSRWFLAYCVLFGGSAVSGPALGQGPLVPGLRLADPDASLAIFHNPAGLPVNTGRDLRLHLRGDDRGELDVAGAVAHSLGPVGLGAAAVRRASGDLQGSLGLTYAPSTHLQVGASVHHFAVSGGLEGNRLDAGILARPWRWLSLAATAQLLADSEHMGQAAPRQWQGGLGLRPFAGSDVLTLAAEGGAIALPSGESRWVGAASASIRIVRGLYAQIEQRRDALGLQSAIVLRGSFGDTGLDVAGVRGTAKGATQSNLASAVTFRWSSDTVAPLWTPDAHAVSLALRGELSERSGQGGTHFGRLLLSLERIGGQAGTRVVVLQAQSLQSDWAQVEELRAAIASLRKRGKRVLFYADDLGTRTLAIASACDKIWLPPAGTLSARGIGADFLSLSEALARVGVAIQVARYSEHKSAAEPLVNAEPSAELRASLQHAIERRWRDFAGYVALGRDVTPGAVEAALAAGATYPPDAVAAHLVDAVVAPGEIDTELRKLGWLSADDAVQRHDPPAQRQRTWLPPPSIAVVEIEGSIGDHSDGASLLGRTMGGSSTAQQIERLRRDPGTAAVVARISSGGGSVFGSEAMRDALARTATAKPVVASMGGVAASGGYWTALGAQTIFADPGTVTGSIGILMVKPDLSQLYAKLGLRTTHLGHGPYADLYRLDRAWSAQELEKIHQQLGRFYGMFLDLTAQRRGLTRAALIPLTGGRIWFGDEALEHKLIDRTGGLLDAIAEAKQRAGLDEDADVSIKFVPEPTWLQQLQRSVGLAEAQPMPTWLGELQRIAGPWLDAATLEDLLRQPQPQARIEAAIEGRAP